MMCDNCLHADVCGKEGVFDTALTYCADFLGWIPVSERLPEENVPVLLGIRFKDDFKYFVTVRMDDNYWSGIGRKLKGMGYWMPLPKPYDPHESGEQA